MAAVDILLRPREAAAALGVSYPAIKQWILAGKLKTIKTRAATTVCRRAH
jgi:excisionase family DNA binding protein